MQRPYIWKRSTYLMNLILIMVTIWGGCDRTSATQQSITQETMEEEAVDDTPGMMVKKPSTDNSMEVINEGQSEFISASGDRGENAGDDRSEPQAEGTAADSDESNDRTVEEGDIYRVIEDGLLANLNSYRGLQLIDIADPSTPQVVGRLPLAGIPVEMYFIDGYAVVMMNNWWGYWGYRNDVDTNNFNGGLVALIDIRTPNSPSLVELQRIPGYIKTSRLTRGMGGTALFVVANDWSDQESKTILRSFNIETEDIPSLNAVSELDLGGYIADIQATPNTLLIARQQGWWRSNEDWDGTYVSLIDISDAGGEIIEGGHVAVEGYVRRKNNLHIEENILRVVSSNWRSGSLVSTWNISDLQNPQAIDSVRFGEDEDLYASLFMSDRAFFVTYRRVDPFHAFAIDSEGHIEERTEYIISGWNDFFRPTFNESRLVGIGMDDQIEGQEGQSIAVSIYSTDLELDEPFIARAHGDLNGWSWSEARYDDRAFSVIENAVHITNDEGILETGLVLLPFSGYDRSEDNSWGRWRSGVQLFTFSEQSVTARGVMNHNSPVRRSFDADDHMVGNLSELSLSLYDRSNPNEPSLLGQVDLAPEYGRVYFVGEGPARHAVRLRGSSDLFYGYYYDDREISPAKLQVLAIGANVDMDTAIAEIEIPARSDIRQIGNTFIALETKNSWSESNGEREWSRHVELHVYDFSNPFTPIAGGSLDLNDAFDGYDTYYEYSNDHWGCWEYSSYWWGRSAIEMYPISNGVALKSLEAQEEVLGDYEMCHLGHYMTQRYVNFDDDLPHCDEINLYSDEREGREVSQRCQMVRGNATCEREVGGEFVCNGSLNHCIVDLSFENNYYYETYECEPMNDSSYQDLAEVLSRHDECYEYQRQRRWGSLHLSFIDLSNVDEPRLTTTIVRPTHEQFEGLVEQDDDLYYSYSVPVNVEGDEISYIRHFTRKVILNQLNEPRFGIGINLPGKFLLRRGQMIVSRDQVWNDHFVTTTLNLTQLNPQETRASFISRHTFDERHLQNLALDRLTNGEERLVVTHGFDYNYWDHTRHNHDEEGTPNDELFDRISILNLDDLSLQGESISDGWSTLVNVNAGRAIFKVGGGVMIMNITDPQAITPQAFFPLRSWSPQFTIEGDTLYAAGGRYGIYTLPVDGTNLLPPL
jgi:hypothetical protein